MEILTKKQLILPPQGYCLEEGFQPQFNFLHFMYYQIPFFLIIGNGGSFFTKFIFQSELQMKAFFNIIILSLAMLLLSACQSVPFTGRSQLLLTSESQEKQLGLETWQEIKSQSEISQNVEYYWAAQRTGTAIAKATGQDDFEWEFVVFESSVPNAFCLPGGKVAVYSGLFKYVKNDAELACVIGHEAGHAVARHGGERLSQAKLQSWGNSLLSFALEDNALKEKALLAYGVTTNVGAILPYSRKHEYEADYMGMIFMAKAGYDPRSAISFWEKFQNASKTSGIGEYLSTHPVGSKRIEEMKKKLPEVLELYYQKE